MRTTAKPVSEPEPPESLGHIFDDREVITAMILADGVAPQLQDGKAWEISFVVDRGKGDPATPGGYVPHFFIAWTEAAQKALENEERPFRIRLWNQKQGLSTFGRAIVDGGQLYLRLDQGCIQVTVKFLEPEPEITTGVACDVCQRRDEDKTKHGQLCRAMLGGRPCGGTLHRIPEVQ